MFVITNCPDGNDIKVLWEYNNGKVTSCEYTEKKAPSDMRIGKEHWDDTISLIKNQVDYETMVKIQNGEMLPMSALTAKKWAIEGDMFKTIPYQIYSIALVAMQNKVPCEY